MKKLRSLDKFAHKVEFNFDNNGSTHSTIIGVICSIFVNIFIFIYVWGLAHKLVNNGDVNISMVTKFSENGLNEDVPMNSTGIVPVFSLYNHKTNRPLEYDDNLQKYVSIYF